MEVVNPLGGVFTYWGRGEETGGAVTVLETVVAPGGGPPLHAHVREDEFICVLEGAIRVRLEDVVREAPAGSFVFVPKGAAHTWQATGGRGTRLLAGFTPAALGMERFFEQAGNYTAASWIAEGFGRHAPAAGIEVLGPPLAQE